ncbi:thioredoxin family protein [Paludibacterium paludis]|uniref:Thiol reductase thioredoxin n=1 Tax=Paludibacterium paludis TaxID=1225769 RepID=A0A918NXS6_9NEIS|nr:thioredoxin family protein [Paludibacterium paludis]GGY03514.1 thiol reductase thioredoxin [Paludibacterium paludis]
MPNDTLAERAQLDALPGPLLVEFGATWCPHCQAAAPLIERALDTVSGIRHIKIEDGPGQPLGRSFRVRLWPTLIFLVEGREIARLVRPDDERAIADELARLAASIPGRE